MGYDALNRLNSGAGFWSTQNLTWDPVGNVLSVVTNSSVTNSFAYVSGSSASPPSRRTAPRARQFAYTPTGNIASDLTPKTLGLQTGKVLGYNQETVSPPS